MDAVSPVAERTFSPSEVLRMVDVGILLPDEPVELLEGRLVLVSPQGPAHASIVATLADRFRAAYGEGHAVREEKPIELSDSLPEPDIAVVRGTQRDYASRHPRATDVVLVVEVALTSQLFDRGKSRVYARWGVPTLWLLDVPARRLEIHADPRPDGRYCLAQVFEDDDEASPPGLAVRWKVRELF